MNRLSSPLGFGAAPERLGPPAGGAIALALLVAVAAGAAGLGQGCQAQRLGGCQTSEREYGLAALADTVAAAALAELMAPGRGPKTGTQCRALGVDTPFYAQIGAVDPLPDETWVAIAGQLTDLTQRFGIKLAMRSLLRHTTGTCFPPHHVDFRGVGAADSVAALLAQLPLADWEGFVPAAVRSERRLFLTAGTSLQLMDTVVDLK